MIHELFSGFKMHNNVKRKKWQFVMSLINDYN